MPHEHASIPYKPHTAIITVSSSRFESRLKGDDIEDKSGDWAEERLREEGIEEIYRYLVRDSKWQIINSIEKAIYNGCELIIIIGGSGVSPSDVSYMAVKSILDEELTAFPALFTLYSEKEVGARAVSTRAVAGFYKSCLIFLLPGSLNAVKTAMNKIIMKEYQHLLWLRNFGKI